VARTPYPVEILTPEGEIWSGEVEMVSTRTTTGSIGLLANHTPMLAMLDPTELRLYTSESDHDSYAAGEGYLQVGGNRALLLLEEAHKPDELDASDLREKLSAAESAAESAEDNTEEQAKALRDKRRWETFLAIAEGDSSS